MRLFKNEPGYSLAWWAAFLATLLMPLAGLAIEMPRLFAFRENLQRTADAAAEACAHLGVDTAYFVQTGQIRLGPYAHIYAYNSLDTAWMAGKGTLTSVRVAVAGDMCRVELSARMWLVIPFVPSFTIHATAISRARSQLR